MGVSIGWHQCDAHGLPTLDAADVRCAPAADACFRSLVMQLSLLLLSLLSLLHAGARRTAAKPNQTRHVVRFQQPPWRGAIARL